MFDPIGPGTPAWNQFDKALVAYARAQRHDSKNKDYKSYCNHRDRMKILLRRHVGDDTVKEWCDFLIRSCKDGVVDEFGEYVK